MPPRLIYEHDHTFDLTEPIRGRRGYFAIGTCRACGASVHIDLHDHIFTRPQEVPTMHAFARIFTAERRQAIQVFAGALAPLFILIGFGTQGAWEQSLIILGAVLQFISSLLSLVNVRRGDYGAGWAIIRGAIYALATVVSPALVLLGFYTPETNATILLALSLALAALSNLLAIFIGKQQQIDTLQHEVLVVREGQTREEWRAENP